MSSANLKSEIAPKGMKFNVNDFIISDKYATILTIISYPKTIQPGFLSNVTNIPGIKVVVKHIPIPFSSMQKMLNREIVDLKDRYQKERDRTLQERLRQDYESLEAFVQMLAATQSKIWDFQMHIMITADTKEDLENKKMQVYCSCPCEFYCKHIYSVLLSIRNKEEKRFYKIMYKNPDKSLLERVMEFDYFLCLGVVEQNLEIINNYGEIELVPILDYKGRCNWTVLEDTEDEKLTKEIKYFLDNN